MRHHHDAYLASLVATTIYASYRPSVSVRNRTVTLHGVLGRTVGDGVPAACRLDVSEPPMGISLVMVYASRLHYVSIYHPRSTTTASISINLTSPPI